MIHFSGYDDVINRIYGHRQEHVFKHWDELNDADKKHLLDDLKNIDLELMEKLYAGKPQDTAAFTPAPFIELPKTAEQKAAQAKAAQTGVEFIKKGLAAAFVVAGGQGSRLGCEGPKGMFPIAPISGKTLFQIHGEKILAYSRKYKTSIPWLVMTSVDNHDDTLDYFEKMNFFGLGKNDVFIFPQNMIPSLDTDGKLVLENPCSIFKNPDGHGGSLAALSGSGTLEKMKERGIRLISYFQVDNPLIKIIDPEFIGYHILYGADISSKAIPKAYPEEKVGVFVKFNNGRTGVVEYSDLPAEKTTQRGKNGELLYRAGNIAVHLFSLDFIESLTSEKKIALPFHTARKKLPVYAGEIEGFKFEKFIFDAITMTERSVIMETLREDEFAPVKNAAGVDSPETSQRLMIELHKKWLTQRGVSIPQRVSVIEISPLTAVAPEDIPSGLTVPNKEEVEL
ncbi:MAG: UDPGP type 1 family protein [Spirochaetia bacterium]|jgi:UDP-N-acetylglucosamine/UDP-N-acetylgalactosamine diphosphorylase|nr:UDPGP type 1 family protein [Spirochaetia bacterium]